MTNAPKSATEAARRRTFAIISHPDAGKTTLTETLLLAGGAIRLAGQVKARGENRRARSDWMKIEQERGISVSASVMTFEKDGLVFNLLDTPGHDDFSEDTYRTLTAADAAIMVLDAAKGVEARTFKLFEVCRLRDIPVITFINKMDREAMDSFALLDEVADKLQLDVSPLYWPVGSGQRFRGMLDLRKGEFLPFERPDMDENDLGAGERVALDGNAIAALLSEEELNQLREEALLVGAGLPEFDEAAFREGNLTPVVWGSALRRFGVAELLATVGEHAPGPGPEASGERQIGPGDKEVSGFIFKIQANMDPNHRDRIAFLRLVSGEFKRGMKLKTQSGKQLSVHSPVMFLAQDRELAETAYPGDVIGVPNHGVLRVGDSLSESGQWRFTGIPNFAPEILRRARLKDPLKAKHLDKALTSLAEEGVTQLFRPEIGGDFIVGAVGQLQIEVLTERVSSEYNVECVFEQAPYATARWLGAKDPAALKAYIAKIRSQIAYDIDGAPVFLAKDMWEAGYQQEKNPDISFSKVKEREG